MSSKPETTFIASVHKHLPTKLYRMKTHNPYISGPADMYYSGCTAEWWVEYKFEVLPARPDTLVHADCSPMQIEWLGDRYDEGRNIAVIVGCKAGGVIYLNKNWESPMKKSDFVNKILTRQELAAWIMERTGGPL